MSLTVRGRNGGHPNHSEMASLNSCNVTVRDPSWNTMRSEMKAQASFWSWRYPLTMLVELGHTEKSPTSKSLHAPSIAKFKMAGSSGSRSRNNHLFCSWERRRWLKVKIKRRL